ncbi:MAG: nickel-dependent lactate racemase [Nitrospinae bacterium]|nr:nickel-dependent lactate racemase [Nitrospinota bacterium]
MSIMLPYGKKSISIPLSDIKNYEIFLPQEVQTNLTEKDIVNNSLNNPIASETLNNLLAKKSPERITVVLSDITRITGSNIFLPELMKIFNSAEIIPKNITYLIASGIHPPCNKEQINALFGISKISSLELEEVSKPFQYHLSNGSKVIQHNAKDSQTLKTVSTLKDGTELKVNKYAVETDFLILTGSITYHYLAGFGGGRKAIIPGVSSYENCLNLHKLSLCKNRHKKNSRAATGVLSGNPMHQHMTEVVSKLNPAFLLNTVCNEKKEIIYSVAGDWQKAFQKGCGFVRKNYSTKVRKKFDAVIVSCGGFPKDINMIQTHKTFENCINLVKEGGSMLILSECSEGVGNNTFLKWFNYNDEQELVVHLKKNFEINGQTALSTLIKSKRAEVSLFTSLEKKAVNAMNMNKTPSVEKYMGEKMLENKSVAFVPYGSSLFFRG